MPRWTFTRQLIGLPEAEARLEGLITLRSSRDFIAQQLVPRIKIGRRAMYEAADIDELVDRLKG